MLLNHHVLQSLSEWIVLWKYKGQYNTYCNPYCNPCCKCWNQLENIWFQIWCISWVGYLAAHGKQQHEHRYVTRTVLWNWVQLIMYICQHHLHIFVSDESFQPRWRKIHHLFENTLVWISNISQRCVPTKVRRTPPFGHNKHHGTVWPTRLQDLPSPWRYSSQMSRQWYKLCWHYEPRRRHLIIKYWEVATLIVFKKSNNTNAKTLTALLMF